MLSMKTNVRGVCLPRVVEGETNRKANTSKKVFNVGGISGVL